MGQPFNQDSLASCRKWPSVKTTNKNNLKQSFLYLCAVLSLLVFHFQSLNHVFSIKNNFHHISFVNIYQFCCIDNVGRDCAQWSPKPDQPDHTPTTPRDNCCQIWRPDRKLFISNDSCHWRVRWNHQKWMSEASEVYLRTKTNPSVVSSRCSKHREKRTSLSPSTKGKQLFTHSKISKSLDKW